MIRRKYEKKYGWKRTLGVLMTATMLCSTTAYAVETGSVAKYEQGKRQSVNEQLASMVNPILQSYTAHPSMKVWSLNADSRFVILANKENVDNERLAEVVKLINAEFLEKGLTSNEPLVMIYGEEDEVRDNDVLITIDDVSNITSESTSPEAYRIDIDKSGVKLTGASENAVLYGLRTIQNLMITNKGLVYGTIVDYPDIAERRVHVDCARKYISKDWFIRQIREMSYMKMNAIQIHFSENLGFRIECETDPSIVSDEYLTKAEVREIIEEARKYGIEVIPSFDTPGHVDQILKAHPEFGQINNKGEHLKSGLDVTNPEAVEYIKSLYREYMELFEGSTYFHIGADEYMEFDRPPFTTEYKSVLNDYARENIHPDAIWKDTLANYINEISALLEEGGFKARIWNDGIYYGENSKHDKPQMVEMDKSLGIDFWSQMPWNRDVASLQTFIDKGHENIYNINSGFFYYVLRNDKPTDGREQNSFDYLNQDKRIYEEWTPGKFASNNTVADNSSFIKGASLAIWCDNPNLVDEDVITEDISKELRSLATKSWNTQSDSIATLDEFRETYKVLGNVAGFEKGSELPEVGEILPGGEIVVEKPSKLKGEATSNEVVLTWNAPKETLGLQGYVIYKDGVKFAEVPAGENTFTATELKANTIYGFKVVSKYSNGEESKPVSTNVRTKKN